MNIITLLFFTFYLLITFNELIKAIVNKNMNYIQRINSDSSLVLEIC